MVNIEHITKVFPATSGAGADAEHGTVALGGINLAVKKGEFVSLVGPSGCGKSTLLRIVAGLTDATSGSVFIGGKIVNGVNPGIGFVFQDPNLFPWLTVRRNVAFGPSVRGGGKKNELVDALLKRVGLSKFADAYPQHLSGGMAQRVALIRALVNRPPVLLLDEPLGALDAFTRMSLQDSLKELTREAGATVLLVTHDIDEALYLSDRIVIFSPRPGRIHEEIAIGPDFPRLRNSPDFLARRKHILEVLHFAPSEADLQAGSDSWQI